MSYVLLIIALVPWQTIHGAQIDTISREESLLKRAFATRSQSLLREFFLHWEQDSRPISPEELAGQPPMVKHAYEVFEKFYRPFRSLPDYAGEPNSEDTTFAYIVIPPLITIRICDSAFFRDRPGSWREHIVSELTVPNFRPRLNFRNHRALFLIEKYKAIMDRYLSQGSTELRNSEARFLRGYIKITRAYGGGVCTFPIIRFCHFDESYSTAEINFETTPTEGTVIRYVRTERGWSVDPRVVGSYRH